MTGLDRLCTKLAELGITHAFGLPGTQSTGLFDALPGHAVRVVLATHELSGSFMANGYSRSSGKVGVLLTIPGPGFTYALPGIAEARLDSVPVLHLAGVPPGGEHGRFGHQAIDQTAMARPVVKDVVDIRTGGDAGPGLRHAHDLATADEPGPVLVLLHPEALQADERESPSRDWTVERRRSSESEPWRDELTALLRGAEWPVLFLGSGAAGAADGVQRLASRLRAPVFTTISGRGIVPEDQPASLAFDASRGGLAVLNTLLDRSDLILALGCRLGHNGTAGFHLRLPADRLVHVNTDSQAFGVSYPARMAIQASVEDVVAGLADDPAIGAASRWMPAELRRLKAEISGCGTPVSPEPHIRGIPDGRPATFFKALRAALPRDGIVVTDSGLHQSLTRRHFEVLQPRGLIAPSDFQSMGFGLPAALGAQLGAPGRKVVAVIGDGGFLMSAMDLLCARRERIPATVVVFNDGHLNLIRLQQLDEFGRSSGVDLQSPSFDALAQALGVNYFLLDGDPASILSRALATDGPSLVEVRLGDSRKMRIQQATSMARASVRRILPRRVLDQLRRVLRGSR